jgi:hypothetical protein
VLHQWFLDKLASGITAMAKFEQSLGYYNIEEELVIIIRDMQAGVCIASVTRMIQTHGTRMSGFSNTRNAIVSWVT